MRNLFVFTFILSILIILTSCDPSAESIIEITNNSPYDLRISFETGERGYEDINLKLNESASFSLFKAGGYREPYYEVSSISFSDIDTGESIKNLPIDNDNQLFELTEVKREKNIITYKSKAYFSIIITDDLLE